MEQLDWNTWGPPIVVLLLGLVVGLVSALRVQPGRDSRPTEARAALHARKDSLMEQLREHDGDRHKMSAEAWKVRREVLMAEAILVLQELDADLLGEAVLEPVPPANRKLAAAWALGLLTFFGLAAGGVSQFTSERQDSDMAPAGGANAVDPYAAELARAQAALEADPDDVAALNTLAHVAIERKSLQEAMTLIDRVKVLAPSDVEMRIHVDALRLLIGMTDKAEASLLAILEQDPQQSEAMRWLSYARFAQRDLDGAVEWLEKAQTVGSERDKLVAQAWLLELRAAQAQLASAGAPVAAESTEAPAATVGAKVSGQVVLGEGVTALTSGRMFVLARAAEHERGPPVAALPVSASSLPTRFGLGEAQLIRGGAWPDQVWLKAKWSAGGDPMTTQPGDLVSGLVGPFSPGTDTVELVLTVAP